MVETRRGYWGHRMCEEKNGPKTRRRTTKFMKEGLTVTKSTRGKEGEGKREKGVERDGVPGGSGLSVRRALLSLNKYLTAAATTFSYRPMEPLIDLVLHPRSLYTHTFSPSQSLSLPLYDLPLPFRARDGSRVSLRVLRGPSPTPDLGTSPRGLHPLHGQRGVCPSMSRTTYRSY